MISRNVDAVALLRGNPEETRRVFDELLHAAATDITSLKNETLACLDTPRKLLSLCESNRSFLSPCPDTTSCVSDTNFEHQFWTFAQLELFARQRMAQLEEASAVLDVLQGAIGRLACFNEASSGQYNVEQHILLLEYGVQRMREGRGRLGPF